MTPENASEIARELLAKTTPGPWRNPTWWTVLTANGGHVATVALDVGDDEARANAALIAAAPELVAALIERVETLEHQRDAAVAMLREAQPWWAGIWPKLLRNANAMNVGNALLDVVDRTLAALDAAEHPAEVGGHGGGTQ